jgi:hypothetical protein
LPHTLWQPRGCVKRRVQPPVEAEPAVQPELTSLADFDFHGPEGAEGAGRPWTATTWTLNSLRESGLAPAVLRERRTAELLAEDSR